MIKAGSLSGRPVSVVTDSILFPSKITFVTEASVKMN